MSGASSVAVTPGSGANIDTYVLPGGTARQTILKGDHGAYTGYCSTFRTPGRAGTAGQKIFAIHNATGSTIVAEVQDIVVALNQTVVKAVTVMPPVIRLYKVTVLPSSGTAGVKVARDSSATATSASLTVWQDASADGTSSGTALAATLPATVIAAEFAPRMITAAGLEMQQRVNFLEDDLATVILRPLEGIVVMLDYTLATQNPVTDMWTVSARWEEYVA